MEKYLKISLFLSLILMIKFLSDFVKRNKFLIIN